MGHVARHNAKRVSFNHTFICEFYRLAHQAKVMGEVVNSSFWAQQWHQQLSAKTSTQPFCFSCESWRSKLDEDGERGPVLSWSSLHLHLPCAQSSMVMSSYKSQKIILTKSQPQYKYPPDHNHQPLPHNSIAAFLLAHSGLWLLPDVTQVSISWDQNYWETATRHVRNLFETTLIHWGCRRETNNKLKVLWFSWNQKKVNQDHNT